MPTRPAGRPAGSRNGAVLATAGAAAVVALVLLGTFAFFSLRGGGGGEQTTSPPPGNGIVGGSFHMGAFEPTAIDPSNAAYGTDLLIAKQLFTGLTEVQPDGKVVPRLAQQLTPNSDCTSWQIKIRQGTKFSNGQPVDAQAFARGWNRAAQSKTGYGLFVMDIIKGYSDVQSGKADTLAGVHAFTGGLQVDLNGPDCEFDRRLATVPFFPVPADAGNAKNTVYNNGPTGNGPFRIQSYTVKKQITLARNVSWYGGRTKLDSVTIDFGGDTTQATNAFDTGETDWVTLDSTNQTAAVSRHRDDGRLLKRPIDGLEFFIPVTKHAPLDNVHARRAVSYAIDRQTLNNTLYGGVNVPATGIVPSALPGFQRSGTCPSCTYDVAKARQEAGLAGLGTGTKLTLVVRATSAGNLSTKTVEAVQRQLESVLGWDVTVRTIQLTEYSKFTAAMIGSGATGMGRTAWIGDYPSAYNFLHGLIGVEQTSRLSDWRNLQFDHLLSQAVGTRDEAARNQLLQQAEKVALDDLALIPLWNRTEVRLANTAKFTGLQMDFDGDPTLATAALKSR